MSTVRIPGAGWEVGEEGAERSPLGATVSETLSLHGLGAECLTPAGLPRQATGRVREGSPSDRWRMWRRRHQGIG